MAPLVELWKIPVARIKCIIRSVQDGKILGTPHQNHNSRSRQRRLLRLMQDSAAVQRLSMWLSDESSARFGAEIRVRFIILAAAALIFSYHCYALEAERSSILSILELLVP